MQIKKVVASAAFVFGFAAHISVAAQTLNAADRGWYRDNPTSGLVESNPDNLNYLAGRGVISSGVNGQYRDYFAFDLSAYAGQTFSSATLSLYSSIFGDSFNNNLTINPGKLGGFSQFNPPLNANPYETFELHQVTTSAADILGGTAGRAGYNDLGDGTVFGSYNATLVDNGSFIKITLNASGLAALNQATGGMFIIGGRVTTLDSGAGTQTVFGFSNDNNLANTQLVLVSGVPEPETFAMMLAGLGLIGAARRKSRHLV